MALWERLGAKGIEARVPPSLRTSTKFSKHHDAFFSSCCVPPQPARTGRRTCPACRARRGFRRFQHRAAQFLLCACAPFPLPSSRPAKPPGWHVPSSQRYLKTGEIGWAFPSIQRSRASHSHGELQRSTGRPPARAPLAFVIRPGPWLTCLPCPVWFISHSPGAWLVGRSPDVSVALCPVALVRTPPPLPISSPHGVSLRTEGCLPCARFQRVQRGEKVYLFFLWSDIQLRPADAVPTPDAPSFQHRPVCVCRPG